ncbi:hypothetical protein XCR_0279 [Xanthomonas campestris pv. raphani 756C]|nr:hypothetical protein XCR_0279 [Xanthomonas campestris pv. raphani 756C]
MRRHTDPPGDGVRPDPDSLDSDGSARRAARKTCGPRRHRPHPPSPHRRFHGRHRAVCCRVVVGGETTAAHRPPRSSLHGTALDD